MKKIITGLLIALGTCGAAQAVTGIWNTTAVGNWTNSTLWTGSMPVNAGDVADITTKNIGGNRTITISSTVTNGAISIGDTDTTHSFTVGGAGANVFNNNGLGATLTQTSTSKGDIFSVTNIVLDDNLFITNNSSANPLTVSSIISGGSSISVAGGAGVTLSGTNNNYSGGTTLNGGKLTLGNSALGSGAFTINGGSLDSVTTAGTQTLTNSVVINSDFTSDITSVRQLSLNGPITLGAASGTSRTITTTTNGTGLLNFGGIITAGTTADRLVKTGAGALIISGQNTFTGGVVLAEGIIRINNSSTAGAGAFGTGTLTISNATTLSVGGTSARTISNKVVVAGNFSMGDTASKAPLTLAGAMDLSGGNRTITIIQTNLGNTIISGVISNGALSVAGALGSGLTLSGENTYADGTTVLSGGKLLGNSDGAFGTGGMTVESGAALILGTNDLAKDYIDDLANLILGGTSVLALNFTGADTVGGISLDGGTSWLTAGTYFAADLTAAGGTGTYTGSGSLIVGGVSSYTLTGSAVGNGTVSPTNAVVPSGGSTNFIVTANPYYRIASLTTNGTPVGTFDNNSTFTNFIWSNVLSTGAVVATFTAQLASDPAATPYWWLAQFGLTNFEADAVTDTDLDGHKNWQEYLAGTNPTNIDSVLKVLRVTTDGANDMVKWLSSTGVVYSLIYKTNLMNNTWAAYSNNIAPTVPTNTITLTRPGQTVFYKVTVTN